MVSNVPKTLSRRPRNIGIHHGPRRGPGSSHFDYYALLDGSESIRTQHLELPSRFGNIGSVRRYIVGGSLGDKVADRILQALRKSKERLSRQFNSQLFQSQLGFRSHRPSLGYLSQHHLAACEREMTDGRPAEMWTALESTTR